MYNEVFNIFDSNVNTNFQFENQGDKITLSLKNRFNTVYFWLLQYI